MQHIRSFDATMAQGFITHEVAAAKDKRDETNESSEIFPDDFNNLKSVPTPSEMNNSYQEATYSTSPWPNARQRQCTKCRVRPALCAFLCCCVSGPIVCLPCEARMRNCPCCGRNNTVRIP